MSSAEQRLLKAIELNEKSTIFTTPAFWMLIHSGMKVEDIQELYANEVFHHTDVVGPEGNISREDVLTQMVLLLQDMGVSFQELIDASVAANKVQEEVENT